MKGVDLNSLDAENKFNYLLNKEQTNTENIVKETTKLPIPSKLEILYQQIKSMITCLTTLRIRKQVTTFARIREIIERETKHSFTQQTLGKALKFIPSDIVVPEWKEDKRRNLQHQLYLNYNPNGKLDNIFDTIYEKMVSYVKIYHKKYLISINERVPIEVKYWHHNFNLESVPDVVPKEINPPQLKKQLDVFQTLKPIIEKKSISAVKNNDENKIHVPKSCENLNSYFTVAKIVQERAQKLDILSSIAGNRDKENVIKLADIINMAFTSQKKKTLPIQDIISFARKNTNFESMNNDQLNTIINDLISKSEGYFNRKTISNKEYLKIEGNKTFQTVRGTIYHSIYNIV